MNPEAHVEVVVPAKPNGATGAEAVAPARPNAATGTERALLASEVRYRRLFESAQDGILILDAASGRILDVNPFLSRLLGYPRGMFLGKHLWQLGPFKDIVASKEAFEELLAAGYIAYEDLPLETSAGQHVDVGFVSNVYESDGKRVIQCNIRDLTQRKAAEKSRVALQDQLRASQKMEAIGSLAGGIAHDFNNLLSVIVCYTGFALEQLPAGDPIGHDLLEVEKAAERASALTRQLLAFSCRQVLLPAPLDLNQVAAGIEKMLQRVLREDIEFAHVYEPNLGMVLADQSQIEQVIMNLVVNARDAMPKGGLLTLTTANADLDAAQVAEHPGLKPGAYVRLAVTDTGDGMASHTVARVFEPFFTTKEPGKGTGLGLSTVHGIVKQSGGDVWVESELGHGSTFNVYLPREFSIAARPATRPATRKPPRTALAETILVVEDEAAVRTLTQRILAEAGYQVFTARNGAEALQLCESLKGEVQLVVTDVVMPKLGGKAFAERLQKIRPRTPILFMSGFSDEAITHHGQFEAGSRFLGKPFNANELIRKVREMIGDARAEAAAAPLGAS